MTNTDSDTSALIHQAREGDESAAQQLLARHRDRLRRMVAVHFDIRLAARIDPSDVVQEALIEASQRLSRYLQEQPIAFYPWLREIAWQRLVHLRQYHLAKKRSPLSEQHWDLDLSDDSVLELANRLISSGSSPSRRAIRNELRSRVRAALAAMSTQDRQVLVLRYLEQLTAPEAAQIIGISADAFTKRHLRAIQRIRRLLDGAEEESP